MARFKNFDETLRRGEKSPVFDRCEVIYLTAEYSYQRWVTWEGITKLLQSLYDQVSEEFLIGEDVTINLRDDTVPSNITPYRTLQYRRERSYQEPLEIRYTPSRYAIGLTREPIWNAALVMHHWKLPEDTE